MVMVGAVNLMLTWCQPRKRETYEVVFLSQLETNCAAASISSTCRHFSIFLALVLEADLPILNPTYKSSDRLSCFSNWGDSRQHDSRTTWNAENLGPIQTSPCLEACLIFLSLSLFLPVHCPFLSSSAVFPHVEVFCPLPSICPLSSLSIEVNKHLIITAITILSQIKAGSHIMSRGEIWQACISTVKCPTLFLCCSFYWP